jgi:signal transduction histidine kinase/DNA-binding response OmpR family regulator
MARQSLLSAASQTAASIDAFMEANLNAVRVEALLPALVDCLAHVSPSYTCSHHHQQTRDTLVSLSRKDTVNVLSYALLDMHGRNVIDTYTANIGQWEADQPYFQQPLKTGLPYASSLQLSDEFGGLVTLHFSSVVRNAHGESIGVLRIRYNATVIQQLVVTQTGRAGAESFAILLDEYHIRLAHGTQPELTFQAVVPLEAELRKQLQQAHRLPALAPEKTATNLPAFAKGLSHAEQEPYFSASLLTAESSHPNQIAVVHLQTQPWRVAFAQPQHAWLKLVEAQRYQTIWVASLIAASAIIFAIIMSQLLVKDLVALAKAAAQFAEGEPNVWIDVRTHDEIGALATAFNHMMARIGTYTENLESLVSERTLALEEEIRERQHIEVALRQAKEAAEAANLAKSEFLANMSHELRTPLNAILGFSQLLSHDDTIQREQGQYLDTINRSGEHLLILINDVLEMSKIDAGRTILNQTDFDLHQELDSLKRMLHLRADNKGLTLTFDLASDVPRYITTDEVKLRQVLTNLLGNAIKFTKTGRVSLRVTGELAPKPVATEAETWQLSFAVEDTGPGIEPDELPYLFDAFVQTRTGRSAQEGTGLGLSISQKFVQLMGGHITVHSQLGKGALFRFSIPVVVARRPDRAETETDHRRVLGLVTGQPEYRILVADDLEENRQILVHMLQPIGFDVREACDGEEVLNICLQWEPHVIWMDVRMPVIDGLEATRRIKSMSWDLPPIIVAITASAFEEDRTMVLEAGCDDFIRKPFKIHDILSCLARHLSVRYRYDEAVPAAANQLVEPLTRTRLIEIATTLPDGWLVDLHQAARRADREWVCQLLAMLEDAHNDVYQMLMDWVTTFQFDQLMRLTTSEEPL